MVARVRNGTSLRASISPSHTEKAMPDTPQPLSKEVQESARMLDAAHQRRARLRSPWACSLLTLATTLLSFGLLCGIAQSFLHHQLDPKGCKNAWMRPAYARFADFDTEHSRFASKYSLYLYREGGVDEDIRVSEGQSFDVGFHG